MGPRGQNDFQLSRRVREARESLERRIWSRAEFAGLLNAVVEDSAGLEAVYVEIHQPQPLQTLTYGSQAERPPDSVSSDNLDRTDRFTARFSIWFSPSSRPLERQRLVDAIRGLVRAYWRGDDRDEKGRILSAQFSSLQTAFEATLEDWSLNRQVALLFADIDNFKAYNDQLGPQEGDRLIAKLSAALQESAPESAVVVHRTGDEFLVAYPSESSAGSALRAIQLRVAVVSRIVADEPPLEGDRQLGLSIGVAEVNGPPFAYGDVEKRAERSLKPGGTKRRGKVSLEHVDWPLSERPVPTEADVVAALAFTVSQVHTPCPFFLTWANALSLGAAEAAGKGGNLDSLRLELSRLIAEIGLSIEGTLANAPSWQAPESSRGDEALGSLDVSLAIVHGLARARLRGQFSPELPLEIVAATTGDSSRVAAGVGAPLFGHLPPEDVPTRRVVVIPSGSYEASDHYDTRAAIHVTIGPDDLAVPTGLFAEQVFVDERPTAGGGLPDFWEAAIAQVITALMRFPNVGMVLVSGKGESGQQTLRRLQNASRWVEPTTADDLADKLGFRTATIRHAGERLDGNVHFVQDATQATALILGRLAKREALQPTTHDSETAHDPPRLKRTLNMDDLALGLEAGCKVDTAYEAFPVALELTRQVERTTGRDQAGRSFKELVDFRIILAQPQVDRIPRFHLREKDELERYFQQQFINETGLFRAALTQDDQLDVVIRHICEVVDNGELTSSRRGILVVPHRPEPDKSLSPLGLVSVRLIPRPSADDGGSTVDYSFTWRTVEALVGLPYSLYGSIRFAEFLTEQVRAGVQPKRQRSLRMGELSYIAHSLHIFTDEYHQEIARRVVNDDTG
jgi:diguanylate cyclase (GGDEF)-like protein